jgi:uncharacterized membrane protein
LGGVSRRVGLFGAKGVLVWVGALLVVWVMGW